MIEPCPHCHTEFPPDGEGPYRRMIEVQGVYDGVLFYECSVCGGTWHRFPPEDYRYERAVPYIHGRRT